MEKKYQILYIITAVLILFMSIFFYKLSQITGGATSGIASISINITRSVPAPPTRGIRGGGAIGEAGGILIFPKSFLEQNIYLKVGEKKRMQFYVNNKGDITHKISLTSTLEKIKLNINEFEIRPGGEEVIEFSIDSSEPGIFTGKIKLESNLFEFEIPLAIIVSTESDLRISLEPVRSTIAAGDELTLKISIKNAGYGDSELILYLKDSLNRNVIKITETISMKRNLVMQRTIKTPQNMPEGSYIVAAVLKYSDKLAADTDLIRIVKPVGPILEEPYPTYTNRDESIFLVLLLLFFALIHFRYRKKLIKSRKNRL